MSVRYGACVPSDFELRLTDDERQMDGAAATAVGETLSDFFRRAARMRAQEVLADQQQIVLSNVEAARFMDALESVDEDTVAHLRDLRQRSMIDGIADRPA